jgi:hypothetical protein
VSYSFSGGGSRQAFGGVPSWEPNLGFISCAGDRRHDERNEQRLMVINIVILQSVQLLRYS